MAFVVIIDDISKIPARINSYFENLNKINLLNTWRVDIYESFTIIYFIL